MTWSELASLLNQEKGHHWLRIGFCTRDIARWMVYERGEIMGAIYHENLFSLKFVWQAQYIPFPARWFWTAPPKDDGTPAQIIDGDVSKTSPFEDPIGVIQIAKTMWHGQISTQEMNPNGSIGGQFTTNLETDHHTFEGGSWIIPPNYKGFDFPVDQICSLFTAP